ncbi:uncharacterized protein [Argopecten irradians]|uniref:uncharacterized protein n=1 Tax=Argopecten irradians TaxID=31199 RepID=UPI003718925F
MYFLYLFQPETRRVSEETASDGQTTLYQPSEQALTRLIRLQNGCQSEQDKGFTLTHNQTRIRYDYSRTANLSVCSVPKAGSTLVTLVLLALELPKGTDVRRIFQTKRSLVHAQSTGYLRKTVEDESRPTRNVIVARDPYRRLFSAYVDKQILRLPIRDANNSSKLLCGNHLTFEQYLHFIVSSGFKGRFVDRHVAPVTLLCKACEKKYQYVAKQETLSADLMFLLKNITNVPEDTREAIWSLLNREVDEKTIKGVVETVVARAADVCSNMPEFTSSLWSVFQLQGILRTDAVFPLEYFKRLRIIDGAAVTDIILKTISSYPLSNAERRRQRNEAVVKAYAGVSPLTIRGIQNMFFKDFLLFGYDIYPPS